MLPFSDNSNGCCPMCRGKSAQVIKRKFLIDHMELTIVDNGPVSVGVISTKILERKGLVWVYKAMDINATDCHHLVMLI